MSAPASPDLTIATAESAALPVAQMADSESSILSRIDFALVIDKKLLLYGWVVGFSDSLETAFIDLGGLVIDLTLHAVAVRRPDVAEHFALDDESHGFYALVDLPIEFSSSLIDDLSLQLAFTSGHFGESRWPVSCHDGPAAAAINPHLTTLKRVLRQLSRQEAKRLIEFARPALGPELKQEFLSSFPPPVQFGIDLCCVLEDQVLVVAGWRLDPIADITLAELRVGDSAFHFLDDGISFARPDVRSELARSRTPNPTELPGFIFVQTISPHDAEEDRVCFVFAAGNRTVKLDHALSHISNESRRDFLSLLAKMEADSALVLIDYVVETLQQCPNQKSLASLLEVVRRTTIERLPSSLSQVNPRYALHIDQVIPVAASGIFLMGWCNTKPGAALRVECRCGSSSFTLSDNWSRHTRTDVTAHLASIGVRALDHEHGFSCYVPAIDRNAPCYLLVTSESEDLRRMHVAIPARPETALETVRSLVASFHPEHTEVVPLMDRQIGPAVGAAWASRKEFAITPAIRSYGTQPIDPVTSVIVPLYGRYDFAEYQLALFADDPDLQRVELIYVVDDPGILENFIRICAGLHGIYQVPFIVAYPGRNLGFAGVNNFASEIARGSYLLFMNSDVMPRDSGWVEELVRTYKSLLNPGVLGVKLLYEDGSIQHVGMAFHRYAGWDGLWINDHPLKGQSPLGLDGVRKIDAVTAACAMVEARLFREAGGFCEDYIIGDFEDSDLCLRLKSAGRQNYISLDIVLYHLERQSQNQIGGAAWRANLTLYNCWLHNRRWSALIETLGETPFLPNTSAA